jgi:hypothetical protein
VQRGSRSGRLEFRSGRATDSSPWAIGVHGATLTTWGKWTIGLATAEVWRQPPLALDATSGIDLDLRWGGEARIRVRRTFARFWGGPADAIVDGGAKTVGFAAGEPLAGGPVLRVGVAIPLGIR